MISRLLRNPAPEYTRLLAMLDFDHDVYYRWLKANHGRLMRMLDYDDVDIDDESPWLRAIFIHEHWAIS